MMTKLTTLALAAIAMAGCASIPPVTARYYLPKAETQITVTQTLGCTADSSSLVVASSVADQTAYSADTAAAQQLPFQKLGGTFVNADAALSFSSDGQLLGINGTSTGEGATIVKNAVTLSEAVAPMLATGAPLTGRTIAPPPKTLNEACAKIASFAASKPSGGKQPTTDSQSGQTQEPATVTLSYSLLIAYKNGDCPTGSPIKDANSCLSVVRSASDLGSGDSLKFTPTPDSKGAFQALHSVDTLADHLLPVLNFESQAQLIKPAADVDAGNVVSEPYLTLNKIATLNLTVTVLSSDFDPTEGEQSAPLWTGAVRIPVTNPRDVYQLPLPAPALFGSENFALSLANDGSIAKLEYGNANGTGDLLTALTAVAQSQQPTSDQQKAAAVQSQADLIYEQQRLVACQINPKTCSSK
jgi:hypothetical protein